MEERIIPCIIKRDAIERGLAESICEKLGRKIPIIHKKAFHLSRDDVISYKNEEWRTDPMGTPSNDFLEYILDYEASDVIVLSLKLPPNTSFQELKEIKGTSFLPFKCSPESIRGFFSDKSQAQRLEIVNGRILERLPEGNLGFPRNIIHIPDSDESANLLWRVIDGELR